MATTMKLTAKVGTRYIDKTCYSRLERAIAECFEKDMILDISDAKFVPLCAMLLSPAYNDGLQIIGANEMQQKILDENKARSMLNESQFPNVIKMPADYDSLFSSIKEIDASLKWRLDDSKIADTYYLLYAALVVMLRPDLDIFTSLCLEAIIELMSTYCQTMTGYDKYHCIIRGNCYVVERGADGLFDTGIYGRVDDETLHLRFKAVPYKFGTEKVYNEWRDSVIKPMVDRIYTKYKGNKGKSLYAFIGGKE